MDRERAKELLPIIEAYAEGKVVQWRADFDEWTDDDNFNPDLHLDYRIKPEPREWWICYSFDSDANPSVYDCASTSEKCVDHYHEYIKVREVL